MLSFVLDKDDLRFGSSLVAADIDLEVQGIDLEVQGIDHVVEGDIGDSDHVVEGDIGDIDHVVEGGMNLRDEEVDIPHVVAGADRNLKLESTSLPQCLGYPYCCDVRLRSSGHSK